MESNPDLIQPAEWGSPGAIPVVLIHDGGGTTFAYHCLNSLSRAVYGIHNPSFHSGEPFQGSLSDMAHLYCGFIKEAIKEPDFPKSRNKDGKVRILLGGWSMGGHLSLEMAKQLDDEDSGIEVIGILMVDTVHPIRSSASGKVKRNDGTTEGKSKNQILADKAMADGRRKIREWTPPVWNGASQRPRTILLRAKKPVPMNDGEVSLVDITRDSRTLGWDVYDKDMFAEIVDIEGDHFDIFELDKIDGTSEAMKEALQDLDQAVLKV
ncbi:hypothetical protein NM208_g12895 [Fusarium decemcellulare]|uniref:Uncharacterized protein n=1 Tax=Fusarium decemcellulare TaxID=57161 RepID=A0ACC1RLU5_9HYPO|nr:hypothetical protein NM208_g12895 [Fusarium decemcellulare]